MKRLDSLYGKHKIYMASFSSSSNLQIPNSYSIMSDFHPICSQHRITGSVKLALPIENGGGILADDMGLGKSLTMLATIAGSLDHAQEYVNSKRLSQSSTCEDICVKSASKSTLVIVPSDCRFISQKSSHVLIYRLIMKRE